MFLPSSSAVLLLSQRIEGKASCLGEGSQILENASTRFFLDVPELRHYCDARDQTYETRESGLSLLAPAHRF